MSFLHLSPSTSPMISCRQKSPCSCRRPLLWCGAWCTGVFFLLVASPAPALSAVPFPPRRLLFYSLPVSDHLEKSLAITTPAALHPIRHAYTQFAGFCTAAVPYSIFCVFWPVLSEPAAALRSALYTTSLLSTHITTQGPYLYLTAPLLFLPSKTS